ncbi:MAG: hypothetical protein HY726_18770 [Candidatus Rokubacteria bacterium]|nr:hypothetical protein [Candidatus Rokubacteria bacterium]
MRIGCLGCLLLAVILVGLGIMVGGALVFSSSIFYLPEAPPSPEWTSADGLRAQQKILEVVRRDTLKSSRTDRIVFTEQEINAFLARHLEENARMPFSPLVVKLNPGLVVIQGSTPFKTLLRGVPFNYLADALPASRTERPVWIVIQGRVRLEHGRVRKEREFLRLEPTGFRIGTLEAGTWFLSWMLGPRLMRWPVPKVIEEVVVEEGRVTVTTQAS